MGRQNTLQRIGEDDGGRRGFSRQHIQNMRLFYLSYLPDQIRPTPSGISEAGFDDLLVAFPLLIRDNYCR